MATNTTNYGFKKPDESDFYDVADQNKNWDLADEALKNLDTPTFEDYTGSTAVPSATDAIDQIKSKGKLGTLLSNIKAAFKGACLIGHIVNNCVTDNAGLPLSAAQGKVLKDLYTQLYSEKADITLLSDYVSYANLPKNFKFLNLKYDTASSYDTEVLKYIESLKESVFIIYCQHGAASMYMGFIVGDGKYGTVLRFEYNSLYINGCFGDAWAGWTKLG